MIETTYLPIPPIDRFGDREEFMYPVQPDLWVMQGFRMEVTDEPGWAHDVEIEAWWNRELYRYDATSVTVRQREGNQAVTGESLRQLPIKSLLAKGAVLLRPRGDDEKLTVDGAKLRAAGPTPETLLWVARLYRMAQSQFRPPTKSVADEVGIPHRTATHWVKLARERGVLVD